jgi:hypothetical protein
MYHSSLLDHFDFLQFVLVCLHMPMLFLHRIVLPSFGPIWNQGKALMNSLKLQLKKLHMTVKKKIFKGTKTQEKVGEYASTVGELEEETREKGKLTQKLHKAEI